MIAPCFGHRKEPNVVCGSSNIGVIVTLSGTKAGLFSLIVADDGCLLLFNLRETPPAIRGRFEIGTRVKFPKHESEPTTRAVELVPIAASNDNGLVSAIAPES
jgi:hypothetical protein